MRQALLILTAREPAIFSSRGATEGQHQTLAHPTGAALLGWAAGGGRYDGFVDPFTIFHSGLVRFSDALPLTRSGCPAYPVPQILAEPKHRRGGVVQTGDGSRRLDPGAVTVGCDPGERTGDGRKVQREALRRIFLTTAGEVLLPLTGSRLRTATNQGRAADGQLFGYTHLDPGDSQRYAATIEAEPDAMSDSDWLRLLHAFDGQRLRLGRAAGTAYGGDYLCTVQDGRAAAGLWPCGAIAGGATRVRIWALSDLALLDEDGTACFAPSAGRLGLPEGGRFSRADSAIGVRRYAPWNGHLRGRDLERQVIEAGSVFSFPYEQPLNAMIQRKTVIGQYQEAGLGRILLAPLLLDGTDGLRNPGSAPILADASDRIADEAPVRKGPELPGDGKEPVLLWLNAMLQLDDSRRTAV